MVEWAECITYAKLAAEIGDYRKQVSKEERSIYIRLYKKWKVVNLYKPNQKCNKLLVVFFDLSRSKASLYYLCILADFPGLIDYLFDNDGGLPPSAFMIADLDERNVVFKYVLPSIIATSPKYQAVLQLVNSSWPVDLVKNTV